MTSSETSQHGAGFPAPTSYEPVLAALGRVEALLARLLDLSPRIAYSISQAGAQLGDLSDSSVRRLVAAGVVHKVPYLAGRVLIPHKELERVAASGVLGASLSDDASPNGAAA